MTNLIMKSYVMEHWQSLVLTGIGEKVCPKKGFEGGQSIKFVAAY